MTHFEQEILDIHVALENWLGAGEGDRDALLARFRPDFLMVPPSGNPLDHHALAQFYMRSGEPDRGSGSTLMR